MFARRMMQVMGVAVVVLLASWVPAMAGSAAIGSLAGSRDATLGGQAAIANTTVFSGDTLHVREGVAVVALEQGSRMVFGRQTQASFLKEGEGVTVLLAGGNVSLYHSAAGREMAVKAGEVSAEPAAGYKTLGEVAMLGGRVVVTTKEGLMKVERHGAVEEVAAGKTVTLPAATADAPAPAAPPAGNSGTHITEATALGIASTAAGGTAALLSALALSDANSADSSASQAASSASQASSNASSATSAANAAANNANAAGCALNTLANEQHFASPYTPPAGFTCP